MTQQTNQREIKIRYTWKRKADGRIYQTITPIECLEGNGDKPFLGNELWEMIGRDLFTGLQDKDGKRIYESDRNQDGGVVIWSKDDASFCWEYKDVEVQAMGEEDQWCEITGSIYDDN